MSQASSLTELRRHIDELAAAIDTQNAPQVLQDLVSQHKQAQNRLNLFVDPMARLPLEIQSIIFLHVPTRIAPYQLRSTPNPNPDSSPMIFLSVCRLWRDIALSTPELWNKIQLNAKLPRPPSYLKLCNMWLNRARSLPLSLSLTGSLDLQQSVLDFVWEYIDQLENLTLFFNVLGLSDYTSRDTLNRLFRLDQGIQLPSLKCLSFQINDDINFSTLGQWLGVLAAAPLLSTLDLANVYFDSEIGDEIPSASLVVGSLNTLSLGWPYTYEVAGDYGSTARILLYLTLPALKSLKISAFNITHDEFFAFLSRSSPPLESLEMNVYSWNLSIVSQFARLVSTLRTLELVAMDLRIAEDARRFLPFFDVLGTSDLLPHLRQFIMTTDNPWTVDYEMLQRVLTLRATACPTRLECFELYLPAAYDYTPNPPPTEIERALRRLVQEGLKIHIGSVNRDRIFLSFDKSF
ncbi:hypothetical protein R3P38DRAFT_3257581 [Favolaschia claudopus]|uniref:F-box domain-containing protein n=1 Tax=Favolaschia claudopus TaxID=2862362 RepID=A0AAW0DD53_9AGAR